MKDANGVYLWGSTDADFDPEAESAAMAANLQANDRHALETGEALFTHERIEGAGNVSVCKWAGELEGQPVTFGLSFLVPGD